MNTARLGNVARRVEALEAGALASLVGGLQTFYMDHPGALGSGTYAEDFVVPPNPTGGAGLLRLGYLSARCEFPFAAGETATLRAYRYRKTAPGGAFTYTQITDTFVFSNTLDWSWTWPLLDRIRDGFLFDPLTDALALSNVYVAGGAPSVRALTFNAGWVAAGQAVTPVPPLTP